MSKSSMTKIIFGNTPEGEAHLFTLKNKNGVAVKITNYGGIITSILVPDRNGIFVDIVLGFDSLKEYMEIPNYFGCIIGRYGNRIANGKFSIDNNTFTLVQNNKGNHLHGGTIGFNKKLWTVQESKNTDELKVVMTYTSPDMEEGYPGELSLTLTYTLTNDNELIIDYQAVTDKKTVCNLTNHSFFNLKGEGSSDILNHELMIASSHITPTNETMIPTGELLAVEGTPFDFRKSTKVGARINEDNQQLKFGNGYDHNYVLAQGEDSIKKLAASLYEPTSGRVMEVYTSEPGVQLYTGNWVDVIGKEENKYDKRSALCLETQHYPDSPNQPNFPSTILNPGEEYRTSTIYKFSVK